jgi:hypothetical protein
MRAFDAIFKLAILRRHSLCDLLETTRCAREYFRPIMYHLPHLERVIGLRPDQRPRPERITATNLARLRKPARKRFWGGSAADSAALQGGSLRFAYCRCHLHSSPQQVSHLFASSTSLAGILGRQSADSRPVELVASMGH